MRRSRLPPLNTIADFEREVGVLERGERVPGTTASNVEARLQGKEWDTPDERFTARALLSRLALVRRPEVPPDWDALREIRDELRQLREEMRVRGLTTPPHVVPPNDKGRG